MKPRAGSDEDPAAVRPDATDRNNLTDRQELALAALMAGATHTEAAAAASVHRVTVTKWANEDAELSATAAARVPEPPSPPRYGTSPAAPSTRSRRLLNWRPLTGA